MDESKAIVELVHKAKLNLARHYNIYHGVNLNQWSVEDLELLSYLEAIEYHANRIYSKRNAVSHQENG